MIIAHIDMDCFFCACEIKRNPSLANKPVIVGGLKKRGVVCTSNYIARQYGVFSAQPGSIAKKLCPSGIFLPVDKELYNYESQNVMNVLSSFGLIEQVSIDEAYIDVSEFSKIFSSVERMAEYMQKKVFKQTGLTCSIGISKSRYVSKIASDFRKPSGITIVSDIVEFLAPLKISKIPGIGKVSTKKYNSFGIFTIKDLMESKKGFLYDNFGKMALHFQNIALGQDRTGLKEHGPSKSVSREITYSEDVVSLERLKESFLELSKTVLLDVHNKSFKTLSLKIRYSDFTTKTRDFSFGCFINSFDKICETGESLLKELAGSGKSIRLLGVKLSKFSDSREEQLSLASF